MLARSTPLKLQTLNNGDCTAIKAQKVAKKNCLFFTKVSNKVENIEAENEVVWKNLEANGYKNPKYKYRTDFEQEYQNLRRIAEILDS